MREPSEADALRAEVERLRATLARIVDEAEARPFNPIGHVIEHIVPVREALRRE